MWWSTEHGTVAYWLVSPTLKLSLTCSDLQLLLCCCCCILSQLPRPPGQKLRCSLTKKSFYRTRKFFLHICSGQILSSAFCKVWSSMSWGTMFTFLHEVQIFLDRVQMLLEASKLNYFASIIIKGTAPGEKCFYRGYFLGTTDSFLPELGTPHFFSFATTTTQQCGSGSGRIRIMLRFMCLNGVAT